MMRAHIFLRQQNVDALTRKLYAVSDPTSPEYGKHLTHQQLNDLIAPSSESVEAVYKWLGEHGIRREQIKATPNFDILEFVVPVSTLEAMLSTTYTRFTHETGHVVARTQRYFLPASVHEHIDLVGPTIMLPSMNRATKKPYVPTADGSNLGVNPASLQQMYSVGSARATTKQSNIALCGFLEQYVDQPDLDRFFSQYASKESGRKMEIIGANKPSNPGIEAMLDVEYGMAMAAGVARSVFWYTPGRMPNTTEPDNEPYLQWLADLSAATNPPSLFSISYGDNENTVPFDYATRSSVEFQKAGARGITIMSSSGDGGVAGSQPTGCTNFIPTFPAGNPYITAIGGTTGNPERAASLSSGGFSNYWDRAQLAPYQVSAADQYIKNTPNLPAASKWNHTGAGFPDISAQAENFIIVIDGFSTSVAGTSCSSPTVAGIFALLNDIRFAAGKSSLGWLNPLLYQNPSAFNDITSGSNPGCGTSGFPASPGWDPVTGLGTPNFAKLSQIVKNLP